MELGIGKVIEADQERDAIHVAVMPVVADAKLYPGQKIGLVPQSKERVTSSGDLIGIVDPFLSRPVFPDQKFWMFLLPNTITSLRHDWTHPSLGVQDKPPTDLTSPRDESIIWVTEFAKKHEQAYESFMANATSFLETGIHATDNSEHYKIYWDQYPEFWKHYEVITGAEVPEEEWGDVPFICSC